MSILDADCVAQILQHDRIFIGLSGGLDSMVLLDILSRIPAIKHKLFAIHVNHGLSQQADHWVLFCQQQCADRQITLQVVTLNLSVQSNIEAAARTQRYQAYRSLTLKGDAIVLAHHLDDQVETFFLNVIRGSGLRGLAAMPFERLWQGRTIYRPMLTSPKLQLIQYAQEHHMTWVDDESNQNVAFARNYLRHEILPKIAAFWPHYRASVQQTIMACQDMQDICMDFVQEDWIQSRILDLKRLRHLSKTQLLYVIMSWLRYHGLSLPSRHVLEQIWQQMVVPHRGDSNPQISWGTVVIDYYREALYVSSDTILGPQPFLWRDFPQPCCGWQALLADEGLKIDPQQDIIELRYRQGGEKIKLRSQHHRLKKLFQELKIPPFMRAKIPLIYVNDELRAVVGYVMADQEHCAPQLSAYVLKPFEFG